MGDAVPGPSGVNKRRREEPEAPVVDDRDPSIWTWEDSPPREPPKSSRPRREETTNGQEDNGSRSPEASLLANVGNEANPENSFSNFFEFGNQSLPKVEPINRQEFTGPPPKVPRPAHYNSHDQEQEVGYLQNIKAEPIPGHEDSSDDSDNENGFTADDATQPRYYKRDKVFDKYNFNFHRFNDVDKLAAYTHKDKIIDAITTQRVVVIEGFTGCGKTTQVPQFIIDRAAQSRRACNIVVTQPRRIAAISVARRVCSERGWEVGSVVGYQVGMEAKRDRFDTLVTYMTTGVLLQKLIRSKSLKEWSHIIIDEVHERDLETDFLLLVIKKILLDDKEGKEKHVKIILMSATLNAKKFSQYFVTKKNDFSDTQEAPIIRIPHPAKHRFVVKESFLDDLVSGQDELDEIHANLTQDKPAIITEIYEIAVKTIMSFDDREKELYVKDMDPLRRSASLKDLKLEKRGSVLVFLPGLLEIETVYKLLNEENRRHMEKNGNDPDHYKWTIVPLHSTITSEEQTRVFEPVDPGRRKIILSTNIAESSITVPDIIYVIDFCLTKSLNVDPRTNFSCLRMVWASISQCIQRKGRTGRVGDGCVYRLVPKDFFRNLAEHTEPEMLKSSLESVVLRVKTLNMGTPKDVLGLAIDPPLLSGIERAIVNLKENGRKIWKALSVFPVGALTLMVTRDHKSVYDTCDGDLTFMGTVMSSLPLPLNCARLIMLGHVFGVMKECIIIAAGLSVKSPFSSPFQKQLESYLSKLTWAKRSHSDCFALLHVYRYWSAKFADSSGGRNGLRNERTWGKGAFVQTNVMGEIRGLVDELEERIKSAGIIPCPLSTDSVDDEVALTKDQELMIKVAIAGAFYPHYFHRHRPDMRTYERERSREVNGYDLFSSVYFKGFPPGHNGKLYTQHVQNRLSTGLDIPSVKFEGTKVIVVFDNRGEKIGPISKGVYRAVKIRQLREKPIEFNVLWKEKELDYLRSAEDALAARRFTRCPPQIDLPGIEVGKVYVKVTHVLSPSQFWVVYHQHENLLHWIDATINNNLSGLSLPRREITPGAFCLAPFFDNDDTKYYRCKIMSVNFVGEALVYYVDYGNSGWVRLSTLQPFGPIHMQSKLHLQPCLAVECRLSEVKPAIVYGSVWHAEAVRNFRNFVNKIPWIRLDIYAVVKSVIIGEIVGEDLQRKSLNVNHRLRHDGFADFAPESYMCDLNHRARQRYELMKNDKPQIESHNREQIAEVVELTSIEPPPEAKSRTELKGCWSPLELEFQSLCHSSSSKQVMIDGASVNSVVLDHEPTAPTSRLLVAAHVAIQDKSGRIVARDSTMMPAVPGLLALMSMLFTAKMELRVDRKQVRYTGVLCGLGTDPSIAEPMAIYQDHDVEIIFDTEFDNDDVFTMNKIRYYMNLILRDPGGRNMAPTHKEIVVEVIKLLKKQRNRVEEEIWPQESYVWNRIPACYIEAPPPNTFPTETTDIFIPHNTVQLMRDNGESVSWGDYDV